MSSQGVPQGAVLAVVHEPVALSPGGPLVLELRGPLGPADAETVAARLAQRHRAFGVALDSHRPGHHTLRLTPPAAGGVAALPADLLADLLAPPPPGGEVLPVTGHQQTLLRAALTPAVIGTAPATGSSDGSDGGDGGDGGGGRAVVLGLVRAFGRGAVRRGVAVRRRPGVCAAGVFRVGRRAASGAARPGRGGHRRVFPGRRHLAPAAAAGPGAGVRAAPAGAAAPDAAGGGARRGCGRGAAAGAADLSPGPPRRAGCAPAAAGVLPRLRRRRRPAGRGTPSRSARPCPLAGRAGHHGRAAVLGPRGAAAAGRHPSGAAGRRHRAERARSACTPRLRGAGDLPAAFLGRAARGRRVQRAAPRVGAAAVPGGGRCRAAAGEFRGAAVGPGHRPAGGGGHSRPAGQPAADDRDRRSGRPAGGPAAPGPRHAAGPGRLPVGQHRDDPCVGPRPPAAPPAPLPVPVLLPVPLRVLLRVVVRSAVPAARWCVSTARSCCRRSCAANSPPRASTRTPPAARPAPPAGPSPSPPGTTARAAWAWACSTTGRSSRTRTPPPCTPSAYACCALPEFRQAQASAGQLLDLLARAATPRMARPVPPAPHPALTVLRPGHPHADVICLVTAPGVPAGSYDLFVRGHHGPETIVAVHGDGAPGVLPAALHQASGPGRRWCCAGAGPGGGRPTNSPSARRMLPAWLRPWS
ncbi:hypothetical protein BX281_10788 [Streptomyces sp. Ag82_O1-15]|nr:hypothetical protein BX281_10788 [Streptomyces sp. Ag82_O1-15]